jgi:hypothetical protein
MFKVQNLSRLNIFQKGKYFPRDIEDSRRPALAEATFKGRDVACPAGNFATCAEHFATCTGHFATCAGQFPSCLFCVVN